MYFLLSSFYAQDPSPARSRNQSNETVFFSPCCCCWKFPIFSPRHSRPFISVTWTTSSFICTRRRPFDDGCVRFRFYVRLLLLSLCASFYLFPSLFYRFVSSLPAKGEPAIGWSYRFLPPPLAAANERARVSIDQRNWVGLGRQRSSDE